MTDTTTNTVTVSDKLKDAIVAQTVERQSAVRFSFWANDRKREGKRDADFTGRVEVNTLKVGELLAQAIKDGKPTIEFHADLWQNEASVTAAGTNRPLLSGKARTQIAERAPQAVSNS